MGYGLIATASGGQFQIDSSLLGTKHLAVHTKGSVSANGWVAMDSDDLILVRSSATSGTGTVEVKFSVISGNYRATFRHDTDYIICKPADYSSFPAAYGLQVKNGSGDVCFDSRALSKGLKIISILGKNTLIGGHPSIYGYNAAYNTVFSVSGTSLSNLYVSCFGAEYSGSVTSGITTSAFNFDVTNSKILHLGFVAWSSPPSGGFYNGQVPVSNRSEILVGELIE
tara:strand:- start:474 stop:1151 length:678 start_codon:yes stop_codon:yes gene_type:complete